MLLGIDKNVLGGVLWNDIAMKSLYRYSGRKNMEGYIDMHCHILPDVDDGAPSVAEMEAMLKIAYKEGIRCIIATPHHHPRRGNETPEVLRRRMMLLRERAHAIDKNFRIYLGTEIYFGQDILREIQEKKILTMNGRDWVLVEFSYGETFSYIQQSLQQVQCGGYEVILAHVERYECIVEEPNRALQLAKMGIHLQVNADSICGMNRKKLKKFVKYLMDEDAVYCVGTDAHGVKTRPPRMKKAAGYVRKIYGEEYARRIFSDNAGEMLKREREDGTEQ